MDEKIKKHIVNRLDEIEKEHNVVILLAIESGSRAWGFESTDSDYDVRFIYKHPKDWYLSVHPGPDVIEYPIVDEFDYSGWDIKKTLFLMNKSNPVLFEWLRSPIVYRKNNSMFELISETSNKYFSRISSTYHYINMAKRNFKEYLKKDMVRIKKYFYVLRPILACMWMERFNESPPMEFEKLLILISTEKELLEEIQSLLGRKKSGVELGLEKRIDTINMFVENKFKYFDTFSTKYKRTMIPDKEKLNLLLKKILYS